MSVLLQNMEVDIDLLIQNSAIVMLNFSYD